MNFQAKYMAIDLHNQYLIQYSLFSIVLFYY